jgi:hypothetical protein
VGDDPVGHSFQEVRPISQCEHEPVKPPSADVRINTLFGLINDEVNLVISTLDEALKAGFAT